MKRIDYDYLGDVQRFVLSTPVYKLKVDNETIIKELNSSVVRLSDNPLDSHFEDFKIDFQTSPKTKELCDTIDNIIIDKFSSTMNVQIAGNKWAHIQQPLESCNPHTHKPCQLSFVYYVKASKNSGDFVFLMDPTDDTMSISIPPEDGILMLFPSWIKHKVNKNLSKDLRISISGNYTLNEKSR